MRGQDRHQRQGNVSPGKKKQFGDFRRAPGAAEFCPQEWGIQERKMEFACKNKRFPTVPIFSPSSSLSVYFGESSGHLEHLPSKQQSPGKCWEFVSLFSLMKEFPFPLFSG